MCLLLVMVETLWEWLTNWTLSVCLSSRYWSRRLIFFFFKAYGNGTGWVSKWNIRKPIKLLKTGLVPFRSQSISWSFVWLILCHFLIQDALIDQCHASLKFFITMLFLSFINALVVSVCLLASRYQISQQCCVIGLITWCNSETFSCLIFTQQKKEKGPSNSPLTLMSLWVLEWVEWMFTKKGFKFLDNWFVNVLHSWWSI